MTTLKHFQIFIFSKINHTYRTLSKIFMILIFYYRLFLNPLTRQWFYFLICKKHILFLFTIQKILSYCFSTKFLSFFFRLFPSFLTFFHMF